MSKVKQCIETGCDFPKYLPNHRCAWHWLMRQPIEVQVQHADRRLAATTGEPRARVPKEEWPVGWRWCAGCQSFVPLFYTTGSRCKACSSRANHESRLRNVYGMDPEEYQRLGAWQGWKCYMCGRTARSRRLAVDHDHDTTEVRGLLCADNERGCNHAILGNVTGLAMARRIVAYLELSPLERMRAGEAPPILEYREPPPPREVVDPGDPPF